MHPIAWGACESVVLGLSLLLVGSPQATQSNTVAAAREPAEFYELRNKAKQLYATGAFHEAAKLFAVGYQRAVADRNQYSTTLFLISLGGARFAMFQYQAALESYLEARRLAESRNDFANLGIIWSNLSSLYMAVGDLESSRFAADRALAAAASAPKIEYRGQLLAQIGYVHAQSGETSEALQCFSQAVEALDGASDLNARAMVLDALGRESLHAGNFDRAELYLTDAFRLRKMFRDRDLRLSYTGLSELRLAQRDVRAASILIDQAFAMPSNDVGPPLWVAYYQRGEVRLAENRIPEAVDSFSMAVEAAKQWREEAAPSDPSGTSTDVGLHRLYASFIDAAMRLPHPPLGELFLAAEEDRAAALRHEILSARSSRHEAGFEYWEKLALLRSSEAELIADDSPRNRTNVRRVGFELNELEVRDKLDAPRPVRYGADQKFQPSIELGHLTARLAPEEAFLSFYEGDQATYLWAVTRDRIEFHHLASSRELTSLAERFRRAVKDKADERDALGERLYRELFRPLSEPVRKKAYWLIAADNSLFELPFSVLSVQRQNKRVFLVEEHSIQRIPSAMMLAITPGPLRFATFIGIGDGIYNTADGRWRGIKSTKTSLQLARLVASSKELRNCAHEWAADTETSPILLTGIYASRQGLKEMLSERTPSVIHIASHILWPRNRPDEALIDLGLGRSGDSEVLTREEISHLHTPNALVVMSGCSSAATPSVPGAGVTGMIRAWLIAGAAVVVGSRWPTPDDSGELFQSFYRALRTGGAVGSVRAVGDAMQIARLDMLHSGTWRSDPSYWGAFYVLGKE